MTLRSTDSLRGYTIRATDGDIGSVDDFLFDDQQWAIRYLVADTGGWLIGRLVLLSPISLGTVDWEGRALDIQLTRQRIQDSPEIATNQPVSRQHEAEYYRYYGYRPYWGGPGLWGMGMYPTMLGYAGVVPPAGAVPPPAATQREMAPDADERGDPHLRSTREVTGYAIQARDGEIGHVEDFIVDDQTWAIRYMVVDTRNWWPGKKVLVAPRWISAVNWDDQSVVVDLARETIKHGPEYDPSTLLNREYEAGLHRHYGRVPYWEEQQRT